MLERILWKGSSTRYKLKQNKYKFHINGNYGFSGEYNEDIIIYFYGHNYTHAKCKAENYIKNHNKTDNGGDLWRHYTLCE